ncbi:outer membrane transport energization protein TonB [Arachidicoccus rhizosphaerae]|uniref:Outer membrane transport energization protein TonB n=1 Tax=Arachidicoccus rhizosphaerae TaxID=551991 RepID=A0A1H3ZXV3_9BACT|nr:energy transducer TonB [Arachidicoccus rhizosphaerae]SEA28468.1 outer membrane transport energization protein TonB [Arachidicoccus rhizosphaerae]
MDAKEILNASQLDILFEGKNKAYGAYALRKNYNRRIELAMFGTGIIVLLFVGSTLMTKSRNIEPPRLMQTQPVHLTNYKKPLEKPRKIPPAPSSEPPKMEMAKLTVPRVTDDNLVKPDEKPPKQTDALRVGPVTQHGLHADGLLTAPPEVTGVGDHGKGNGVGGAGNGQEDYNKIFPTVQVEARYPGGPEAWKKYLERSLRSQIAVENGAATGIYKVVVSFLVAKDGTTSEVQVVSAPDPDFGTAGEAVRVIERSGKWNPAIQNGRVVKYREKQTIIFQVE